MKEHALEGALPDPARILVVDDEREAAEAIGALLEAPGRLTVTCSDLEAAQLLIEREEFTHIISDVRMTGRFAFEGLDFIGHVKRHAPEACYILISGQLNDEIRQEAMARGAAGCLSKPFGYEELRSYFPPEHSGDGQYRVIRTPPFEEITAGPMLNPHFQPIVSLQDIAAPVAGFEALSRLRTDSIFKNPEVMFEYAVRKRRVADLERACARRSLEEATKLPGAMPLFLNLHPDVLAAADGFVDTLLGTARERGIDPSRIVLEITEQATLRDESAIGRAVALLSPHGVRFAFDDVGEAYSHLRFIDVLKPAFLKVSQRFGGGFEADATKRKIVSHVLSLAGSFSCDLILEGVETAATADAAREMGIRFAQGYYFGRPRPVRADAANEGPER